ncbi:MAG: ABC transporter permease, partial [Actinomycetota bacterium]
VLLFGYVFSWVMATLGLVTGDPEAAQAAAFPAMAPLVFASSAFVPIQSMPGWLQWWAQNQPVSVTANAVRSIVLGQPAGDDVLKCLAWCVVLLAIFVPFSVSRYRKIV